VVNKYGPAVLWPPYTVDRSDIAYLPYCDCLNTNYRAQQDVIAGLSLEGWHRGMYCAEGPAPQRRRNGQWIDRSI